MKQKCWLDKTQTDRKTSSLVLNWYFTEDLRLLWCSLSVFIFACHYVHIFFLIFMIDRFLFLSSFLLFMSLNGFNMEMSQRMTDSYFCSINSSVFWLCLLRRKEEKKKQIKTQLNKYHCLQCLPIYVFFLFLVFTIKLKMSNSTSKVNLKAIWENEPVGA